MVSGRIKVGKKETRCFKARNELITRESSEPKKSEGMDTVSEGGSCEKNLS